MENTTENVVASALGLEPEATVDESTESATTEETTTEVTETTTEETVATQPTESKGNSTIRQMREEISKTKEESSKYQKLLQRIADSQGVSVEQLESDLQAKEDKKKAESLGVSPEVAAQLRRQEERIKELEEQTIKDDFMRRVADLKSVSGLNDKQVVDFCRSIQEKGVNPMMKGMDLTLLYRAANFDKLRASVAAEERQKVLNEIQAQREHGNSIPSTNAPSANGSSSDDMSDVDFMDSLKKLYKK